MENTQLEKLSLKKSCEDILLWVGAISFEPRCIGSLSNLLNNKDILDGAFLIDYPTTVVQKSVYRERRKNHVNQMKKTIKKISLDTPEEIWKLHPYHLSDLEKYMNTITCDKTKHGNISLILDITCLTKAHTIGMAVWLSKHKNKFNNVIIGYTSPEQYIRPAQHAKSFSMWDQVIFAPCVFDPNYFSDRGDGIILPGHDGSRLSLALSEYTPGNALVVLCEEPQREELQIVTRTSNSRIIGQIIRGEMDGWGLEKVNVNDLRLLEKIVTKFSRNTSQKGERLILYPFGPKIFIFSVCLASLKVKPGMVWYCYPIPKQYDVNYTLGIGETKWFIVN